MSGSGSTLEDQGAIIKHAVELSRKTLDGVAAARFDSIPLGGDRIAKLEQAVEGKPPAEAEKIALQEGKKGLVAMQMDIARMQAHARDRKLGLGLPAPVNPEEAAEEAEARSKRIGAAAHVDIESFASSADMQTGRDEDSRQTRLNHMEWD